MSEIQKRQNESDSLDVQYVARFCFNRAEKQNRFIWYLCFLSLLFVLIPNSVSSVFTYGMPLIADIVAFVIVCLFNRNISSASKLREAFDNYVFGFTEKLFVDSALQERIIKVIEKNTIDATVQKRNTGNDNPPGVKNWYNTNSNTSGLDAIFICQKENQFWEKKLLPWRLSLNMIFIILCSTFFAILIINGCLSIWRILLSSSLILRACERIYENYKYQYIGNKIDGIVETLETGKTVDNIKVLQSVINDKRRTRIVGNNHIYRVLAIRFSNLYNRIIAKL